MNCHHLLLCATFIVLMMAAVVVADHNPKRYQALGIEPEEHITPPKEL